MSCITPDLITVAIVCVTAALCTGILIGLYYGQRAR